MAFASTSQDGSSSSRLAAPSDDSWSTFMDSLGRSLWINSEATVISAYHPNTLLDELPATRPGELVFVRFLPAVEERLRLLPVPEGRTPLRPRTLDVGARKHLRVRPALATVWPDAYQEFEHLRPKSDAWQPIWSQPADGRLTYSVAHRTSGVSFARMLFVEFRLLLGEHPDPALPASLRDVIAEGDAHLRAELDPILALPSSQHFIRAEAMDYAPNGSFRERLENYWALLRWYSYLSVKISPMDRRPARGPDSDVIYVHRVRVLQRLGFELEPARDNARLQAEPTTFQQTLVQWLRGVIVNARAKRRASRPAFVLPDFTQLWSRTP